MTMKSNQRINLSDEVIVKLTESGIESLFYFYKRDNLKDLKELLGDKLDIEIKEFRSTLADLINVFGDDIFIDDFIPFDGNCIYLPPKK
ncbi:MAG: hypothetical protein J6M60_07290 [Clostridia bacterium]|nr:hypothetical protein [Clostridia bacterium]